MLEAMPVKKLAAGGRPIVRVLPQPIYDSEIVKSATATSSVTFFAKPLGNPDASGQITAKTLEHTNLKQSGSLAKPYEFDLYSFNLKVVGQTYSTGMGALVTTVDFLKVLQGSYLEFTLGNRVYLDLPLTDMPSGVAPEGYGYSNATTLDVIHNGTGHRSNAWKFTVGKFLVHIRSTESFQITINFQQAITVAANTMLQCYMNGLMYNAI
jgi:hypothetical protein